MAKGNNKKQPNDSGLNFEAQLWAAADKMRGHMDASEYKHVCLGLIFLKYISDSFEEKREQLLFGFSDPRSEWFIKEEPERADAAENRDEYLAANVFWLPPEARWHNINSKAKSPEIGKVIDDAMGAIERENPTLKGVLPRDYARSGVVSLNWFDVCRESFLALARRERRAYSSVICKKRATTPGPKRTAGNVKAIRRHHTGLDKVRLGGLVDIISNIGFGAPSSVAPRHPLPSDGRGAGGEGRSKSTYGSLDVLGRVYEYFLGKFASAEGKGGGEFYTRNPSCNFSSPCSTVQRSRLRPLLRLRRHVRPIRTNSSKNTAVASAISLFTAPGFNSP
jgi:type I restriction-modification system DNA methylase subunit